MNKLGLSALALVATAGSAFGQVDTSRFQLQTFLQLRTNGPAFAGDDDGGGNAFNGQVVTNVASPHVVDLTTATLQQRTIRMEIRYKIQVLGTGTGNYTSGGTTYRSAGLNGASLRLQLTGPQGLAVGDLKAAPIGGNGSQSSAVGNTSVGNALLLPQQGLNLDDPRKGIYDLFRTGSFIDSPAGTGLGDSNGTFSASGLSLIIPVNAGSSGPGHSSASGNNGSIWGIASYDFIVPANAAGGDYTFTISQDPGSEWLFTSVAGATATPGTTGTGGFVGGSATISVIAVPAPGAAALLGLGGLVAARRRRTA